MSKFQQLSTIPILSCHNLTAHFGLTNPLSFKLTQAGIVGVIGANGAGKSTLLRLLLGVEASVTGHVLFFDKMIRQYPPKQRPSLIGYLPQNPPYSLYWTLTELISQGFNPALAQTKQERTFLLEHTLSALQLTSLAQRRLGEVSGGELRRALVARALIQQATITLLDEPLAHLDWGQRELLLKFIRQTILKEERLAIIAFHDLNLATLYCDRLILLTPNASPQWGSPAELLQKDVLIEAYGQIPTLIEHPHQNQMNMLIPNGSN